jgi:prolyl 4-hydroxylase
MAAVRSLRLGYGLLLLVALVARLPRVRADDDDPVQASLPSSACPAGVAAAQTRPTSSDQHANDKPQPFPVGGASPRPHDHRAGRLRPLTWDDEATDDVTGTHHRQRTQVYLEMNVDEGSDAPSESHYGSNANNTTHDNAPTRDGRRLCLFYNLGPRTLHLIRQDDATGRFALVQAVDAVAATSVMCSQGEHYLWLDRQQPQAPVHEVWIPDSAERHFVYRTNVEEELVSLLSANATLQIAYERLEGALRYETRYRQATGRSYLATHAPPRPLPQHYLWSAHAIGHEHKVALTDADGATTERSLLVLSTAPRILIMDNFVSHAECQEIKALALAQGLTASETARPTTPGARTSSTTWLRPGTDPQGVVARVYQRAAQLVRIPNVTTGCAEDLQVVHYQRDQEYRAHYDFTVSASPSLRLATLLLYLEDGGGATYFPLAAGGSLQVPPRAGTALLFYNVLPDGNPDERSLHASLPVVVANNSSSDELPPEKWIANLWIWDPEVDMTTLD